MNSLKYILIIALVAVSFSCETEYIANPNTPEVAPTYALMNRVQKRIMDDTRDQWFMGRSVLLWVQYLNQNAYTEEDRFQYRETTNKSGWDDLYKNAQDLIDIISFNTDEATKSSMQQYGPNENQIAAARILLSYVFLHATEVWGDVPYWSYGSQNESFQSNKVKSDGIAAPKYASQADIYADLLKELKEAQAMIITSEKMVDGDNLFSGDATQWKKFANSLRLRIANRVKGVYPDATAHISEAISAGVMESNEDNAGVQYEANAVNGAPFYRAFVVDAREDFSPSYQLVQLLKGKTVDEVDLPYGPDPRLNVYVADNEDGNKVGIPLVSASDEITDYTRWSIPGDEILKPDYTEYYMEYSEVCFLLSEINNWDQAWYEKGVRASLEKWGVAEADIASFVANLPAASQETVLTQKYVALFMQPLEAWSEYRRTGYPKTLIMPGQTYTYTDDLGESTEFTFDPIVDITDLPSRTNYLLNEASINSANVNAAASAIGGDELDSKLWWME
jgi:hypothetical protein